MTEKQVVKILNIMQSGTDAEKATIQKLYPDIYRVYIPSLHDSLKIVIRHLYEMNSNNGEINLKATIVTPFVHKGISYQFLTTVKHGN